MQIQNVISIMGRIASTLALTSTAAQTPALSPGIYAVWADADSYVQVRKGSVVTEVTIANGYKITANAAPINVKIPNDCLISAITATTAVAITWILSILLKTSVVFDADNDLNPVNLNTIYYFII